MIYTDKMLDLSTGHIKQNTRDYLEDFARMEIIREDNNVPIRVLSHRYGFIVFCTDPKSIEEGSITDELLNIIKIAYDQGCILINFDQDAEKEEDLEYFD